MYDPGLSGKSKNIAESIAKELQSKGYNVDLAGINSPITSQIDDYDIIIIGGPIYAGKAAKSVQEYLKTLNPRSTTRIGVFATGDDPDTADNKELLLKEAAPIPENSNLQIDAVIKIVNNSTEKISAFVNDLLI
ncbi:MAG: flavodoxin domain-containing protein [Methanobacteriaceae archaeon]|nr:flavodoxin domain-containing protein [Methanobacteriaceae archaeon]